MAATQTKRRLDDEAGDELATLNADADGGGPTSLPPHLREEPAPAAPVMDPKDQRIAQLQGKLKHLRKWMQTLQFNMQTQAVNKDLVCNARRLFVGGLPPGTTDDDLRAFLNEAIVNTGAAVSDAGRPVAFCRVQRDKNFAFVEVRSAEEASNTIGLDGIVFNGAPLKIKRPSKYDAQLSFCLGPTDPDPSLDLSKVVIMKPEPGQEGVGGDRDLAPGAKYVATHNTLYIGGLPMEWSVEQILELLKMYGEVQHFKLMTDKLTGNSRGFAFAEYSTDEATIAALAALDGAQLGNRRIAANRMLEHKQKQQQQWGGSHMGGWGGRSGGWEGGGGMGGGMNMNMGMQQQQQPAGNVGYTGGGMGGMMGAQPGGMEAGMGQGAAAGGMQQQGQGGYGMGGGYPAGGQQQGMYGAPGAGVAAGGMSGGAVGGMGGNMPFAGAAAGGMDGSQQGGMYGGMGQQGAAAAGSGGYNMCGGSGGQLQQGQLQQGQMQQGAGMYGNAGPAAQQQPQQQLLQPQQGGMLPGGVMPQGAPMPGASMAMGTAGGAMGPAGAAAGAYGQQGSQMQQQQQPYSPLAGGVAGQMAPQMGQMGVQGQMGMQGAAAGVMGGMQQQTVPDPNQGYQSGGAGVSQGMAAGNMGGWQGQQQAWGAPGGQQHWG